MQELALAIDLSTNQKTGPLSATYASQNSCPTSCPLRKNGCYAESGPMAIHTRRLNQVPDATGLDVAKAEAAAIEEKISGRFDLRLHVVGDCASNEAASIVSTAALNALRKDKTAFSYTHAWADVDRSAWGDVSILASTESPTKVKQAQAKGWATAVVVADFEGQSLYQKDGIKILPCPQQTRGVSCVDCRLCFDSDRLAKKGITIGFKAHGSRFKVIGRLLPTLQ